MLIRVLLFLCHQHLSHRLLLLYNLISLKQSLFFFLFLLSRGERDISEKIALGIAQPKISKEAMFDSRLFNQSSGLNSGFANEDAYSAYDKPLFAGSSANQIYRPKRFEQEEYGGVSGVDTEGIEKMIGGQGPSRGFKGAEGGTNVARDGPVQFEKEQEADPFGLEQFLSSAKRGREKTDDTRQEKGSMHAA